jgi:hypothetical protein
MENYITLQTDNKKHRFTNKKKIDFITFQEASHSSIISVKSESLAKKNLNNNIIDIEGNVIQKEQLKNFKKKDITQFKELLHKPSSYPELKDKPYYQALLCAQMFKAPILYAELFNVNPLPKEIMKLITIKYICLHDIPNKLEHHLRHAKIMCILNKDIYRHHSLALKLFKIKTDHQLINNYVRWSDNLHLSIKELMEIITLPQSVILSLICNAPQSSRIRMQLTPSMPGFNSFYSLPEKYSNLLLEDLPIGLKKNLSQNDNYVLTEIVFNI